MSTSITITGISDGLSPQYTSEWASGNRGAGASNLVLSGATTQRKVNSTYKDIGGVLTNCYGHTGKELKLGQTFTDDECVKQLGDDILKHDKELSKLLRVDYLTDYEHAAILSFTYNVGVGNVAKSTLLKKLNEGDHIGACSELVKWSRVQGKDCKLKENNCSGIVTRREQEMKWCLGDIGDK